MTRPATKPFRLAPLSWPPTERQWQALSDMLEDVYQRLKEDAEGLENLDADNLVEGTVPVARMPGLTGEVTAPAGSIATTLAASGVTAGTYGDGTHVPQVTVDAKGRVTSAVDVVISAAGTSALLSSTHTDTTPASPSLGDIIVAQAAAAIDTGNYWLDGQAIDYLPNSNDNGEEKFWLDGLPGSGLSTTGAVKWARKANGTSGYVWTAGATGPDWQPASSGSSLGSAAYRAADFSLADRTPTAVTLDTETFDDGDFWTSSAPTRMTVPVGAGGAYVIAGLASWDAATVGSTYAYIYVNGTKRASSPAGTSNAPVGYLDPAAVSTVIKLNAGDYVELYVEHAANVAGTSYTVKGGSAKTFLQLGRLNSESVVATGLPSPAAGAIIKGNAGATAYERLIIGAAATYLRSDGAAPAWSTLSAMDILAGVLATARGGTSVDIASAALPLGSGQIAFPATQNPSADANTLDDYEEGTFTPSLIGTGGQSGQVYGAQVGYYVKVGQLVFFGGRITLTTLGTLTGSVRLSGLPFTVISTANNYAMLNIGFFQNFTALLYFMLGYIIPGTTQCDLIPVKAAATSQATTLVQGDLANTSDFIFSGSYRASA